ncbi:MAG: GNAT family N-acetyltransferase [Acholeplasmataceae bacterium]|nr:GNAT family N-acetyltransferase [Acholeplasmataceae bacterium]
MIRKATLKDSESIFTLSSNALDSTFNQDFINDYIIIDNIYHFFVLEENTNLLGFIILWESDKYGQIIDLVVTEEQRSKGYGKQLLTYGLDYLATLGVKTVTLEVKATNLVAIKLYELAGFRLDHTKKNYYGDTDGLFYLKEDLK